MTDAAPSRPGGSLRSPVALSVTITAVLCCALLILPGATVSSMYLNDLLIFLDGGYRVVAGQIPNRDFHTALGPLSFYIPGLGYWLTGRLGMAMPVGMSALIVLTASLAIPILGSRMRPLLAVPVGVFLLLLATPMNIGETIANISFAMYYNRIGWALLGLLLVMHLRPERPRRHQILLDTVAAATLTLLMAYTKVTYGVVAVGFLALVLLFQPAQRLWAASALGTCLAAAFAIELAWGGTRMHVDDLLVATNVSGKETVQTYLRSLLVTSGEYLIFIAIAALALWQRPRFADFLFYGFCICAGFALLNQNFQEQGVVTLLAGAAVAAEILARRWRPNLSGLAVVAIRGAPLAAILLLLPIGLTSAAALGLHAAMAASGAGTALGTSEGTSLRVVRTLDEGQFRFYRGYAESLEGGVELLAALDTPPTRVLVLDFVSPFSSLARLAPPEGGTAWMHDGRNFNRENHFPADEVLGGVDVVMIPKRPVAGTTRDLMLEIYGEYLDRHFRPVRNTDVWRVLQRRPLARSPALLHTQPVDPYPAVATKLECRSFCKVEA